MIQKDLKVPISLQKLEALLRRLPFQHPKIPQIKDELKNRQAGFYGETAMTFPLSFLDPKKYHIFRGIRLLDGTYHFQMDILLLSTNFVLIMEVKNYGGTLYFDPVFNQLIQTKDGKEIAYSNPLIQVHRHEFQLKKWFATHGFPQMPIYSLVIISNPRTIIRTSPDNHAISKKVLHRDLLPLKINQIEKATSKPSISEKDLKKTIRLLKKQHTEGESSIIDQYQIKKSDLVKGVYCPVCSYIPILRHHATWFCPQCRSKHRDAHIHALNDYYLLIGLTISNGQLRDFLLINSPSAASRLLHSLNLPQTGTYKNKVYYLSKE
ncbi:nuclease-related domain-containing protein [Peribacillus alkalitolerans]|uniref:nuclease-related domain-containing protein n=1 Tax=Peribacillus alkalitolerans TaxID=1550385 RepID=UPI0013D2A7BC|nr:nuclease-related domain-containing protein [Peribacillus alkalitolerans]